MNSNGVAIREFYSGYRPPRSAFSIVQKLIRSVPEKYLRGLDCVVLTNQSGLSRRDRLGKVTSRGRRHPQSGVTGRYHHAQRGEKAWIELFVDKIEEGTSRISWVPLLREIFFGMVLFHEIGHHIDYTVKPEFREKENVADDWAKKLYGNFFRREHRYLLPIRKPLARLLMAVARSLTA
jgi:hypothetical protein